jgi:hypothetical protein
MLHIQINLLYKINFVLATDSAHEILII